MDYSKSKYQNETAEAADAIVNEGLAEATAGDVETGGHYALVVVEGRHVIIRTDSQGFVWVDAEEQHHLVDHDHIRRTWEAIERNDTPDEEQEAPGLFPVRFIIGDDDRVFRGYSDGTTWNGFDQVYVTPRVHESIKAYIVDVLGPEQGAEQVADLDAMPIARQYGVLVDMNGWTTISRTRENDLRRLALRASDRHNRRLAASGGPGATVTADQDRMLDQAYALYCKLTAEMDKLA